MSNIAMKDKNRLRYLATEYCGRRAEEMQSKLESIRVRSECSAGPCKPSMQNCGVATDDFYARPSPSIYKPENSCIQMSMGAHKRMTLWPFVISLASIGHRSSRTSPASRMGGEPVRFPPTVFRPDSILILVSILRRNLKLRPRAIIQYCA